MSGELWLNFLLTYPPKKEKGTIVFSDIIWYSESVFSRMITGETLRILSKEQKIGFVLLLCFGLIVVVLGVIQLRNTIYSPFVIRVPDQTNDLAALFQNNEARLQQIDTDRDGLNDYEELNFFQTSPYLPDTDSDGISDNDEISVGSDPNCPTGQTCQSAENIPPSQNNNGLSAMSTNTLSGLNIPAPSPTSVSGSTTGTTGFSQQDLAIIMQNPSMLRQLLLETGQISKEQLDTISDSVLLEQAEQFLKNSGASARIN